MTFPFQNSLTVLNKGYFDQKFIMAYWLIVNKKCHVTDHLTKMARCGIFATKVV